MRLNLRRLKLLWLVCCMCLVTPLCASDYFYTPIAGTDWMMPAANTLYNEEGMYLWIGTNKGIFRFDGYDIKHYQQQSDENVLHNCIAYDLTKDAQGNLWVSTNRGIGRYNRHTDQFEPLMCEGCPPPVVRTSCLLKDGVLFGGVGTLFYYDYQRQQLRKLAEIPEGTSQQIKDLYRLSDTEVILSLPHQVVIYNLQTHTFSSLPVEAEISSLFVDNQQQIWVGCFNKGLICMDRNGQTIADFTRKGTPFYKETVICMEQRDSLLWAGTDGDGIKILNPATSHTDVICHEMGEGHSFPSNSISCLYQDAHHTIWVGSVRNGVFSIKKGGISFYSEASGSPERGLSNSAVLSLLQGKDAHEVWIGTDGEGINKFNLHSRQFTHYASTQHLKVVSIARLNEQELLLSIYLKGLYVFHTQTGRIEPFKVDGQTEHPQLVSNLGVLNLVNESERSILILTDKVQRLWLDSRQIESVNAPGYSPKINILWAGKYGNRQFFYDVRSIYYLTENEGELHQLIDEDLNFSINSAYIDQQGTVWMATNVGIYYYSLQEQTLQEVPTNLLKNASIIFPDNQGRVWVGEGDKLYAYQPDKKRFAILGETDGVHPNQYIKKSRLLTDPGDVILGGTRGLLMVDHTFQLEPTQDPKVVVTGLQIDNTPVLLPESGEAMEVNVPSGSKRIELRVATIDNDILRPKVYRYKVTGSNEQYDESYTPVFTMNTLRSGKSSIYVSCSTRQGEWTPFVRLVSIDYPPVWYQSFWFFLLCIFLLLSIPVFFVINLYRRKKRALHLQLKEKEKDIYQEKVTFLININHELRTPLTLISGPLKLMLQHMEPQSANYLSLQKIYRQSVRMKNLLNMVLDLRKMEVGEKTLKIVGCDVNAWVEQIVADFTHEGSTSDVRIEAQLSPEVKRVNLDAGKCEIILTNLLVNAIKHSQPDNTITVKTELTPNGMLKLSVIDQGVGFQGIDPKKLFSRFYQGSNEKHGTGIGLSYSKVLVELQNGEIGAYNNEDKGVTFYFQLPLNLESGEQKCVAKPYLNEIFSGRQEESTTSPTTVPVPYDVSHYTLLLVDDSHELTSFLKESLEKSFKKILVASNGAQAWDLIQKHPLDIIVSDVMMPEMDGYELCRHIKSDINYSHLPVILLTAKNEERNEQQGYKMGADAFLSKPFDVDTLFEIIKNNLKLRNSIKQKYMQLSVLPAPQTDTFSQVDENFLLKLNKIICENINNTELDIPFLCREIGMSKTSLYNKLKALTDMGCNEYITKIRLERAMEMIRNTDKSFVDIAFETGFANSKYFSTCFKQYAGMTPSQYKKEHK